ncbi:DUF3566 domain-containing protein [Cellulomonas sp. HZM]|uniref:DUF3566 domain-containing protein n=1 Tax=Cellulomonas sp. HZM TaxID=1454010 RepID=UPI000492F55C|nr:DUF3566 domain-containing protein [Cellulomonas sp. HZM]
MTESAPPSIPPRNRPSGSGSTPSSGSGQGRSVSSRANPTSARAVAQVDDAAIDEIVSQPVRTAPVRNGRSVTSGSRSTGSAGAASAGPGSSGGSASGSSAAGSSGSSSSARSSATSSAPSSSSTAPDRTATSATKVKNAEKNRDEEEKASREATSTRQTVPGTTGASEPATDDEDQPSPLAVAVDSTTAWLKKVAGATSAAITTATKPRTEDDPMTSSPVTAPPAARPTPAPAGIPAGAAPRPSTGRIPTVQSGGGPRRVRLAISRFDPWSVMKLSFLLSVAVGIMIVVGVAVAWFTLNELHVFAKIDDLVTQVTGTEGNGPDVLQYVEFKKVLSAATLVAVVDVFLLTAIATIGAFLYNIVAALVGGLHVTMTDE